MLLLLLLLSGSVQAQSLVELNLVKVITTIYAGDDSLSSVPAAIDAYGKIALAGTQNKVALGQGANMVITHLSPSLQVEWQAQWNYSGASDDYATDVAVDDSGNVYVAGYSIEATSPYYQRLVVLKYSSTGVFQWQYVYGGTSGQPSYVHPNQLVMDGQNVYVSGAEYNAPYLYNMARYVNITSIDSTADSLKMTLLRLNTNGTQAWRKQWTATNTASYPGGLAVAGSYVYLAGQMDNDTLDGDLVVYKYSSSGTQQWMHHYSHSSGTYEVPLQAVADPSGHVYITGHTRSNSTEESDILALKYESNGTLGWALAYDAPDTMANDWSNDITYADGYVYFAGQSDSDVVVLKVLADDGTPAWTQRWEGSSDTLRNLDRPYGVVVNDSGTVFVGGFTSLPSSIASATFFMLQYSQDGTQSAQYSYSSGGVVAGILPMFIFKGMAQDTAQNMYMLAAHLENDTVRWQVLKFGDTYKIVSENADSIRYDLELMSVAVAGLLNDNSFKSVVRTLAKQDTIGYEVLISKCDSAYAGFRTTCKASLINAGYSPADTVRFIQKLEEFGYADIQFRPTIYVPAYNEEYFPQYSASVGCWDDSTAVYTTTTFLRKEQDSLTIWKKVGANTIAEKMNYAQPINSYNFFARNVVWAIGVKPSVTLEPGVVEKLGGTDGRKGGCICSINPRKDCSFVASRVGEEIQNQCGLGIKGLCISFFCNPKISE